MYKISKTNNELILNNNIVFSKKDFTVVQSRIFYYLITKLTYNIRKLNDNSRIVNVPTIELKKIVFDNKNRISITNLELITKDILKRNYLIIYYNNGEEKEEIEGIAMIEKITPRSDNTFVKFTESFVKYMELPENKFSVLSIFEICNIKKINSIKAYEICCTFKAQKHYLMKKEKFKEYFKIKDSYFEKREVNTKIIKPIENDLRSHTQFNLHIEQIRTGKEVTHYRFDIKVNEDKKQELICKAKTTMSTEEYTTVIEEIKQDEQIINKIDNSDLKYSTDKLVSLILKFDKSRKISQTTYKSWSNDIRKIVEVDGRTYQLVNDIIDYTSNNEYWSKHITSGSSLRSKFDTIVIQSKLNIDNNIKSNKDKKEFLFVLPEEYTSREEYMESYEFDKKYGDNYREYLKKNYPNKKLLLPRFKIYHKGDIDEYIKTEEFKNLYGDECERYKRKKSEVEEYNRKIDIYNAPKNNLKELIKKHKAAKAKSVPPPAWM